MKIYCNKCKIYLGEIRDAKLRKNIVFYCNVCNKKLKRAQPPRDDKVDYLKTLFGM